MRASNAGTVQGWLSAHIYLGASLLVVATLHAGFQVGWNVHTLALVLMLVVIFSGFFGVFAYVRYPTLMTRNRQDATRDAMLGWDASSTSAGTPETILIKSGNGTDDTRWS